MTDNPTDPTGPHPDIARLAGLDDGLDDGFDDDGALRAHVSSCASCTTALAAFTAVRAELRALPASPMPADVAARLDGALKAAGVTARDAAPTVATAAGPTAGADTASASEPDAARTGATATIVPLDERRRRPSWMGGSLAGAAAAVVLLALGVGVLVNHINSNGGGSSAGNQQLATAPESSLVVTHTGRVYTNANLVAALPGLLAPTPSANNGTTTVGGTGRATRSNSFGSSTGSGAGGGSGGGAPAPHGGTTQGEKSGSAAVPDTLDATGQAVTSLLTDPATLSRCISELGTGVPPLAVDVGSYRGHAAAVFVFPTLNRSDRVDVYIVRPNCPTGSILYFARIPRA